VADWTRQSFDSVGLTQIPTGLYLKTMQRRLGGGTVTLLIDVSGSMQGPPLAAAVVGARRFVDEAVEALYSVGIILWHTSVADERLPTEDGQPTYDLLTSGNFPSGGTDLYPALVRAHEILGPYAGDRVVAVFGDGDLGTPHRVMPKVEQMKRENIRFVTRGLGDVAAQAFGSISDEAPETARVDSVEDLADGIAGMATVLRKAG
jgi:uncharacterized protein with von Willebrand factor type A (vWA) domain